MPESSIIWIAYSISNLIGVLFLIVAYKRPRLARLMFALLFGWACWFNYTTSHQQPQAYMMYAEPAMGIYAHLINGWFKDHITFFVSCIAIGQGIIALGMLLKGWWLKLACSGVVIFLLAIAPLGVYSAFPFSLTVSAAAILIMRREDNRYLWKWPTTKPH